MKVSKLELRQLQHLVIGSSILSTGGGGSPSNAMKLAREIFSLKRTPKLVDPEELKKTDIVFSPGDVGGGIDLEEESRFQRVYGTAIPTKWKKWPLEQWAPSAVKELSKYLRKNANAFLSTELGPGGMMSVLKIATIWGKPMIDGDTVGRAVPEMTMSKLYINHSKIIAGASTSHFGDVLLLERTKNLRRLEDIARSFSISAGGGVGLAIAIDGRTAKRSVIRNTATKCIDLGEKVSNSDTSDKMVKSIVDSTNARLLFVGRNIKVQKEPKRGHLIGAYLFKGTGDYKGHSFKVWFKNENHISWFDEKFSATSPDIISIFDPKLRMGVWNWDPVPKDRDLYIFGIPCDKRWRSEVGLAVLGPKAFGFYTDYKPVEKL
ncbi:MAG: DUF917 domain-containing protein [Nitrososphaerota archaeon]|nr:DUF917 domain-containing protein [Nitrososphaerota archaeon]